MRGEDRTPQTRRRPFRAATIATADGETLHVWHLAATRSPERRSSISMATAAIFRSGPTSSSAYGNKATTWWRSTTVATVKAPAARPSKACIATSTPSLGFVHERLRHAGSCRSSTGAVRSGSDDGGVRGHGRAPDGMVLEAGFPSMRAVVETNPILWALSWFSSYEFPTARWMSAVHAPALVLHGDATA